MNKIITLLTLITILFANSLFSQITYLDFTGLSNNNPINNIAIGGTGEVFSASMSNSNSTLPDPEVDNIGNINLQMNSQISQQCINLTFSAEAQVYLSKKTTLPGKINQNDELTFDNDSYTLIDPDNLINMTNTGGGNASFIPTTNITVYDWNLTFTSSTSIQICAQRTANIKPDNLLLPLRIGVVTATIPLELINFELEVMTNKNVQINWQTASEINNDYFTLEKSNNTIDWKELRKIDGAGNSSLLLDYSTIDKNPYGGDTYYRLKQTDFDGEYTYSVIKSITISKTEKDDDLCLYPNPFDDILKIRASKFELLSLQIIDMIGQNITDKISVRQSTRKELELDFSSLKSGFYFVRTKSTFNKVYKK